MMALGSRSDHVFRLLAVENALLGTAGGLLGVAFGIVLALAVSAIGIPMPPPSNANIGYIAHIRIAVSYTHLDVYKRQPQRAKPP